MVNQEIFGGLISAMSRGESLQKAMFSLFNAGYKKEEIEEAARLLQSQTPTQIIQKQAEEHKQLISGKTKPNKDLKTIPQKTVTPTSPEIKKPTEIKITREEKNKTPEDKKQKNKKPVSQYGEEKNPEEFKKVIEDAIKSLQDLKSPTKVVKSGEEFKPPIIIQRISDYNSQPEKKVNKSVIWILFILLVLLLGSLVALFVFKDKLIEIFNNISL